MSQYSEAHATPTSGEKKTSKTKFRMKIVRRDAHGLTDRWSPTRLPELTALDFVIVDMPHPLCAIRWERLDESIELRAWIFGHRIKDDVKLPIPPWPDAHPALGEIRNREKCPAMRRPHPNAMDIINPVLAGARAPNLPSRTLNRPLGLQATLDRAEIVALHLLGWGGNEIRFFRPAAHDLLPALKIEIEDAAIPLHGGHRDGMFYNGHCRKVYRIGPGCRQVKRKAPTHRPRSAGAARVGAREPR